MRLGGGWKLEVRVRIWRGLAMGAFAYIPIDLAQRNLHGPALYVAFGAAVLFGGLVARMVVPDHAP
jgi:hypothetical protein